MTKVAILAAASLLAAGVGVSGSARAAGPTGPAGTNPALSALGTAVPTDQLGHLRGGYIQMDNSSYSSVTTITQQGNAKNKGSVAAGDAGFSAGNINGAVNNNSGVTTVFANTGNNVLFQNSTAIYVNIH